MNIKINTKKILSVLVPFSSVVPSKALIPILQSIKIDVTKKGLNFTGDNLEIRYKDFFKIKTGITKKLSFCVDFNKFLSVIRALPNQELTMILNDNVLNIEHLKGSFKIPVFEASSFPADKENDFHDSGNINSKQLKSSLKNASKFMLNDGLDAMSNLSIEVNDEIIIRSTNRASLYQEKIDGSGSSKNLLIGISAVNVLNSLLMDSEVVDFYYNDNLLYFDFGNKKITVIQQDVLFPVEQFKKILSTGKESYSIKADLDLFTAAINRASALSNKGIDLERKITLNITKKGIVFSCNNETSGTETKDFLECSFDKESVLKFDSKKLKEIIQCFGENSKLKINDKNCLFITNKNKKGILAPMG